MPKIENIEKLISVIIPNYNGAETIDKCLRAVFSSRYKNFEVIVVDDCSKDNSVRIIERYPCKLITLKEHSGTSVARNIGASNSNGEWLFFIDADCLLLEDTLVKVNEAIAKYNSENIIIGGTYTSIPYDDKFFSTFQSVFVNYSETKKNNPDYIAAHAMAINTNLFKQSRGFPIDHLPILEDVELSHRLRRMGCKLIMEPKIVVRHIFNFSLIGSMKNAFRKSMYWVMYSIENKDLLRDSGTASLELKADVASLFSCTLLVSLFAITKKTFFLPLIPLILFLNLWINMGLLKAFYSAKGLLFSILATLYYIMLYPLYVGIGSVSGALRYFFNNNPKTTSS